MLKTGTGIQSQYDANLPFTMIGVPNRPWMPTAIQSKFIDPNSAEQDFIPGITFVSRTITGTIVRGIQPNSNLYGIVMRGASKETANLTNAQQVFNYEDKGPVPVGTTVTTWIQVISAPTAIESFGIAINDETGQATTYAVEATAGFWTTVQPAGDLADFIQVTDGSVEVKVDAGVAANVPDLDFSAATDLTEVAAIIEAGLTDAFCTYNQQENVFVFTSAAESAASAIVITAGTTGTDITVATYLNAIGGTATAGTAAGSAPANFTAAPGISIERWSASDPTKVEVSLPSVSLE